jgi:gamma-glutamyltranspeptidase/glutathione hydrolase
MQLAWQAAALRDDAYNCAKNSKLFLVLGSPGGPRIITTVANILMGVVDYGMNLQEAVNASRFHHQWLPDEAYVERGAAPDTVVMLHQMGHRS